MNYRHGDLMLKRINKLPKKLKKLNHNVLAHGETTGHRHVLVAERENMIELFEDEQGRMYFKTDGATVRHEEHKTITIEPGIYFVEHEQEYDPFSEEIKKVID